MKSNKEVTMFSFGWFSSGRDQAAIDLLAAAHDRMLAGFIPGRIAYVFCDREPGETPESDRFIAAVQARELPLVTYSSRSLRQGIKAQAADVPMRRNIFDSEVISRLQAFEARVVVLAGYMLIISPRLCRAFLCLNLHPAFPGGPKGTWQQVMWELMAEGRKEAGGMMHLATPELDSGPPVTYFRFRIVGGGFEPLWSDFLEKQVVQGLDELKRREGETEPLFAKIRAEELRREFPLILLTLKNLAENRFRLTPDGVIIDDKLVPEGVNLTEQIEEFFRGKNS
jgi:phosphoribosylglycinamide formyltransferase-1